MEENEFNVPLLPPLNSLQPWAAAPGPLTLSSSKGSLLALGASPAHVSAGPGQEQLYASLSPWSPHSAGLLRQSLLYSPNWNVSCVSQ